MKVEQLYTNCLAQGAYYIESNGEAAVIDPLREVQPYLNLANERGATIKYIFETHFHADFVSGHVTLAEETGATIVFGPNAETGYNSHIATDGEVFKVGELTITTLHTPGHTMESTTYLLKDAEGKELAIFSGDTLFIGDVGRPDLAVKSDLSQADLAGHLFDSLRNKIMTLPDDVVVYPGHGAGSACGKNMSKETQDTLGNQKATNYALRADMSKEEFVKEVTEGLSTPPQYFPANVAMNKGGYESIVDVLERGLNALDVIEFKNYRKQFDALVIDTRNQQIFKDGFIPGSWFVGLGGQFAPWVGALVTDLNQPILIIADEGKEEEVITRLSRVGYDNTIGYLAGGFDAWKMAGEPIDTIESIDAETFKNKLNEPIEVIDIRKPGEYEAEHIDHKQLQHLPLDGIFSNTDQLDKDTTYYIHCAGGYRSMIEASILKAKGFDKLVDIKGGFGAIKEVGIPTTDFVCPSTK